MTELHKAYNPGVVFGRREALGWRGVRTGIGQFWETGQWTRRSVNFDSRDQSIRRRGGQIVTNVVGATVDRVRLLNTVRVASIGTSFYIADANERERTGSTAITF